MTRAISLESRVAIPPHVLFRHLDDELVLLELTRGVYFGLDPVGTRIWQLLAEERPLRDVLAILVEEYDVDAGQGAEDVLDLVQQLRGQGLLEVRD